jgi:hypothetical protein
MSDFSGTFIIILWGIPVPTICLAEAVIVKTEDSDPILELTRLAYFYQRHGLKEKAEEIFTRIRELRLTRGNDPLNQKSSVEDTSD